MQCKHCGDHLVQGYDFCTDCEIGDLRARILELKELAEAVTVAEFSGIRCLDVDGVNWFDRRAFLLNPDR